MISKIFKILEKKDITIFKIIFVLNFFSFFLEFLSLALIPLFVGFILDIETVLGKLENYGFFYFSDMSHEDLIKYVGILIIFVFVVKNLFYYSLVHIQGKFEKKVKIKLSKKLLGFYVYRPFSYHLENNPAILTRNTTNSIDGFKVFLSRVVELFKETLTILVVFILLSFINIKITIIVFCIFSIFGYFYLKVIRPSYKSKAKINENFKVNLIQTINETFGAIKDIKILNKENDVIENYNENRNKYENNLFYFFVLQKIPKLLLETLAIILIVIAAFIIFNSNTDLLSTLTILSLIVVALVRFLPAFNSIISSIFYIRIYQPTIDILFNEVKKIEIFKNELVHNKDYKINNELNLGKNLISLQDVSFSYDKKSVNTLKNINLDIKKGTFVGVTGETGAGKSTLFHIMLGLLQPNSGNLFFKDKNIYADIEKWREQVGYIAQNIYLLDDTIEKNISFDFVNEVIDENRMNFSIKMSCLEEKILELPQGLKTKVGNDGIKLSGGERQRIALARSIYRNPDIFFMDESTSALDSETEKKIIQNIKENFSEKTIILIAHRKTTIDECDRIINLKDGQII
jgi:ATP-binding cassette subfamily C protein